MSLLRYVILLKSGYPILDWHPNHLLYHLDISVEELHQSRPTCHHSAQTNMVVHKDV